MRRRDQGAILDGWRERLRAAIARSGVKHSVVAHDAGIAPETLSRILTASHLKPSAETVRRVAHAIGENIGWIFGEEAFTLSAAEWRQLREVVGFLDRALLRSSLPHTVVPPIPNALRLRSRVRDIPSDIKALGGRLTYQVIDDSLQDAGVLDGDRVYVKPETEPRDCVGSLVVCKAGTELYAKKLARTAGLFWLLSRNDRYAPLRIENEGLEVFGVVVGRSGPQPVAE